MLLFAALRFAGTIGLPPSDSFVVCESHNGKWAVVGRANGRDLQLSIVDRRTHRALWSVAGSYPYGRFENEGLSAMVAFSPSDERIAIGGTSLSLYDLRSHRMLWRDDGMRINAVAFSPDGGTIVGGGALPIVAAYDATTGRERWRITHGSIVISVAVSPDASIAASGSDGGGVRIWNLADGAQLPHLRIPHLGAGTHMQAALAGFLAHEGHVAALAFAPDGSLLSGAGDGSMRLWDVRRERMLAERVCPTAIRSIVMLQSAAVAPCFESGPAVFNLPNLRATRYFGEANGGAAGVWATPDAWIVYSNDGTFKRWDARTFAIETLSGTITSAALAPDGNAVAYTYGDRIIHVASTASFDEIGTIRGAAGAPYRCCIGRDYIVLAMTAGEVLADTFDTAGFVDHHGAYDGVLHIWSLDGREIERYKGITASEIFTWNAGRTIVLPAPAMTDTAWSVALIDRQSRRVAAWDPKQTVSDRLLFRNLEMLGSALPVYDHRPAILTQAVENDRLVVSEREVPSGRLMRTWHHTFPASIHGMVQDRQNGDIVVAGKEDGLTVLTLNGSVIARNARAFAFGEVSAMDAGGEEIATLLQPQSYGCDGSYHLRVFSAHTGAAIASVDRPVCAQNVQFSNDGRVLAVQTARGVDIWSVR
jgi:WD40 repeat protein